MEKVLRVEDGKYIGIDVIDADKCIMSSGKSVEETVDGINSDLTELQTACVNRPKITIGAISAQVVNGMLLVVSTGSNVGSVRQWKVVGTLPVGYRPADLVYGVGFGQAVDHACNTYVAANGNVGLYVPTGDAGVNFNFYVTCPVAQ